MNKKIVTLILVILVSFCFLSIVVADNATNDDTNATDHDKTTDNDKTIDKDKKTDKDKTKDNDKSKKNYIKAKGSGNDIRFSDGYRGYRLDYSKPPASSGDDFKHASTSSVSNANELKQNIIKHYKKDSTNQIGKAMSKSAKSNSSNNHTHKEDDSSYKSIGDHAVIKIDKNTEAIFDFEVLKSVSGNVSDYFAYKVSFRTIANDINQTNNLTNVTNTTANNLTNLTNTTNITHVNQSNDNGTNATFLQSLYDYLASLANALFDSWKPIIDTLINDFLMIVTALEELANLFENFMMELQSLIDALEELLDMLESLWEELTGLFKLFAILLGALEQLLNLIGEILNFIAGLISAIISLIQQVIGLILSIIDFIIGLIEQLLGFLFDLINQIISLIQALLDFLKSVGSYLINVIQNGVIIIATFVIITIGAFVYNRIR